MPAVYSVELFSSSLTTSPDTPSGPVPTGFVWVVRSVTVIPPGLAFQADGGWTLVDDNSTPLAGIGPWYGSGSQPVSCDIHHVVGAGGSLTFRGAGTGYAFKVSGYQLTLP
jgi:hypothetical protein